MTQDQNESNSKKLAQDRLQDMIQKERNSHTDRKVRRNFLKRIERLDEKTMLDLEEE